MHGCENEKVFAGIHPPEKDTTGFKNQESWKKTLVLHDFGEATDIVEFDQVRPDQIPGY
ncbi:hypothetical protein DSCW_16610 [Desulfosarcina widdelii]|uniref:Uncharacterized protein n=1 Tax=Desulfosarcina widdelii TaxID=947919 RepID=A0A5K7Z704_9BACT|nr:hypothetical protein [Desulfosarcina widdelii]BBO74244.1 hypothetical protein DSCW_16610 [Desulfosarcina widdelii]